MGARASMSRDQFGVSPDEIARCVPPGSDCRDAAYGLQPKLGGEVIHGAYIGRDADPKNFYVEEEDQDDPTVPPRYDHAWLRLPDDTIVDASADQFGESHHVRVLPPGDPIRQRYVEWDNPADSWVNGLGRRLTNDDMRKRF